MVLEQEAIDTLPQAIEKAKEKLVQMRSCLQKEKAEQPQPLKNLITDQFCTCKKTTT